MRFNFAVHEVVGHQIQKAKGPDQPDVLHIWTKDGFDHEVVLWPVRPAGYDRPKTTDASPTDNPGGFTLRNAS